MTYRLKVLIAHLMMLTTILIMDNSIAGPFLDLDIGTDIGTYNSTDCVVYNFTAYEDRINLHCEGGNYVGDSGTLGIVRVGYETDSHQFGPVEINGHAYFMHLSDWRVSDGGLDMVAIGIRIR